VAPEPTPAPDAFAPVPLLRLERVDHLEDAEDETPPDLPPLTQKDLLPSKGTRPPMATPIVAWSRLLPALEKALRTERDSREIDTRRLVELWSRGERLDRLPRRSSPHLSTHVTVLLDRAPHLAPFWDDQERLVRRLRRLLGRWGFVLAQREDSGVWSFGRWERPRPTLKVTAGDRILAVSDLGMYRPWGDAEAWHQRARRLRRQGAEIHALVPCPPSRWHPGVARAWQALDWAAPLRGHRPGPRAPGAALGPRHRELRARLLLRLMAPAVHVSPGLLRELRRLMGPKADLGTEADAWSHPDFAASAGVAGIVHPEKREEMRRGFGRLPETWRSRALQAIDRWHRALPADVWAEELLEARLSGALPEGAMPEAELARTRRLALRLAHTVAEAPAVRESWPAVLGRRLQRLLGRAEETWQDDPELAEAFRRAWATWTKDRPELPLLPGMPPPSKTPGGIRREWPVWQVGPEVELRTEGEPTAPGRVGAPLASPSTAGEELVVAGPRQWGERVPLQHGRSGPLSVPAGLVVVTERHRLHLRPFHRPSWAHAGGRDQYGLWASFKIDDVEHRLRWIPPGRFWMGSPESEQGRWDHEGPRHLVTLTSGYWLGETPCTQALWEAVLGENPSEFRTPDRPVERLSWEDCETFLSELNERVPGHGFRLPTEAEWEHACRAGTQTSTYAGELEILGQHNAPLLDDIAWYGGNSGEGYELEEGRDSSGWSEMQYPNPKSGTHPVKLKRPNNWGLYDTLGNVWEWCQDRGGSYSPEPAVDPQGPSEGAARVLRGGSWGTLARVVRAAYRRWIHPGLRWDGLGFRLARGQGRGAPGLAGRAVVSMRTPARG